MGLVLGISETWLNEGVSDAEVKIQGFQMYRRDRLEPGVVVYQFMSLRTLLVGGGMTYRLQILRHCG